jgi:enoyl-[acyl-carrier protein] reductase/trans-2-enoyl-CoA reductase (NAD+)
VDDWEMSEDVQNGISSLWGQASTETLPEVGDLNGYKSDFLNLFGFGYPEINYLEDINEDVKIDGLV